MGEGRLPHTQLLGKEHPLRTCPNGKCRAIHEDHVGQCPTCGAPMNRAPDVVMDPNTHLYGLRANAGQQSYGGMSGMERRGDEPYYPDTRAVMETAREVLGDLMGVSGDDSDV